MKTLVIGGSVLVLGLVALTLYVSTINREVSLRTQFNAQAKSKEEI